MKKTTLFEKAFKKTLNVRKNSQGLMGSKTRVHKDEKKETSKKQGRKKVSEEDENVAGGAGSAFGPAAGADHRGISNTDWYAPGDSRIPKALGVYSRKGKVKSKSRRKRAKKK